MEIVRIYSAAVLLACLVSSAAFATGGAVAEWEAFSQEAKMLYRTGKYDRGVMAARKALEFAEKNFGRNHANTAASLNSLALLYHAQSQYAQAEPLYKRALAIREKNLDLNHPDIALSLNNLAELYRDQGQYAQAEPLYMRALSIWEKSLGPDHPAVAKSMNNLALLYYTRGQYAQAEPLYKRSLAISEKTLGPNHSDVALSLNNLASLYCALGQYAQAEPLYKRSLAILEKALGQDHPDVAASLGNMAKFHSDQGQYAQAEPLYKRSLAIREKVLGMDHLLVASSLNNLAELYRNQGRYAQAEPLCRRSLAIHEKALGMDHPLVASSLNNLAELYRSQGRYAQAELLYKRSLVIHEKALGPNHSDVAVSLGNLANLYKDQGRHVQAEPLYLRSLAIREKNLGPDHPDIALGLNNLAELYRDQGQYAQAEPLYKRSLAIHEKVFGPDHSKVATSLGNLAQLYSDQDRHAQAEPLYKHVLAIHEKTLGPDHPSVATGLSNLGALYLRQNRYAQAGPVLKRSLAIYEKALGPDHPFVAAALNSLAGFHLDQGQYAQAEPLYKRSLAIREKTLGTDHPAVATSLNGLALLYQAQRQYAHAEPLYRRSLAIYEKALGPDHPAVATGLDNFALLYNQQGRYADALPLARRVSAIYRQRIMAGGTDDASVREAGKNRDGFFNHLSLLARNPGKEAPAGIADESFQVVQLEQATGTSAAVAKMAVRFAKGDDAIAGLVRRKQDALARRSQDEVRLVNVSGQPSEKRNAANEQALRGDITRLGKEIDAADAELAVRFPEYQELTHPAPLPVSQVQAMLHPNEAMMVYAIAKDQAWLWVIRSGKAEFLPLKADQKTLAEHVRQLRGQMEFDHAGKLKKVDVARLHDLYQNIFAPAVPYLAGIDHVMLVPAGPLESLPFGMFVASPPREINALAAYREVDWLAKRYALSVLPSVSSIRAFRRSGQSGVAQEPFIGFGDPLLQDDPEATRLTRAKINLAALFRNLPSHDAQQTDIADINLIRQQPRLPETAEEIKTMARIMKAGLHSVWLQEKATETNVKKLDLSKYRIIAFATHGTLAGQLDDGMEPGLLLTPPAQGSLLDDGYLAAGEIARLKLNADWVLLSACNTAAADGSPGAEGLSGLSKAFFYAGSRSLLVSHWPVISDATVPLTTGILREYEIRPAQGKAEAHRKAILALMNTSDHPEYAHPIFWAPFVVVGEGGRAMPSQKTAR